MGDERLCRAPGERPTVPPRANASARSYAACMPDVRALQCAEGESALQRVLHRGLGRAWADDGDYGWSPQGAPHRFLLGAVTLTHEAPRRALSEVQGTVCDSFRDFDAYDMPGRRGDESNPWMHRAPAALNAQPLPVGVAIRPVTADSHVAAWERVVFESNGGPPSRPGELHPAGSQRQPGLSLLLADFRGRSVGAALGLVTGSCVVVSAVAVLPEFRGAGLGIALTQRVLALAPGLPATLSSSEIGHGVYRRLGFVDVGRPIHWA